VSAFHTPLLSTPTYKSGRKGTAAGLRSSGDVEDHSEEHRTEDPHESNAGVQRLCRHRRSPVACPRFIRRFCRPRRI